MGAGAASTTKGHSSPDLRDVSGVPVGRWARPERVEALVDLRAPFSHERQRPGREGNEIRNSAPPSTRALPKERIEAGSMSFNSGERAP